MTTGYQNAFTSAVNRIRVWRGSRNSGPLLRIGYPVPGRGARGSLPGILQKSRSEHLAILGKTGSGKTSLLRFLCEQDIRAGHGFVFFDLHGDTTPYILGLVAEEERRRRVDLSERVILIDPTDRDRSVGINILEASDEQAAFVEIAETVEILKRRWKLDTLGVRTDELLRHTLYLLHLNRLTILEAGPLLTSALFRNTCLIQASADSEAHAYFRKRYDLLSIQMQGVYREAVLNKISIYTSDPHFRHLLGQRKSTVNLKRAVDSGSWVVINLEKGKLGEEASTLGALLLAKLKHAILGRKSRRFFALYCDELQNLVAYDQAIDVLLSEARKFGVGIISANQYLDQYSPSMRAAVLAMGAQAYLQLSAPDARRIAWWLGEGNNTAERLRSLPHRHVLLKGRTSPLSELVVPNLTAPLLSPFDLVRRVRSRITVSRNAIEDDIRVRTTVMTGVRKESVEPEWD